LRSAAIVHYAPPAISDRAPRTAPVPTRQMQAKFITSARDAGGFPEDEGVEVAVVGRSNSGKSSAINRIVGHSGLARVSKTPGRTQLINFFGLGASRRLVDLPGYGFARVPESVRREWRGFIEAYLGGRRSLKGLLMTVDVRRGLRDTDRAMVAWARELGLPVAILLTKADKLSRGAAAARRLEVARELGPAGTVTLFSALDGTGLDEARAGLEAWLGPAVAGE
jgi:GTP-binding protein